MKKITQARLDGAGELPIAESAVPLQGVNDMAGTIDGSRYDAAVHDPPPAACVVDISQRLKVPACSLTRLTTFSCSSGAPPHRESQ